MSITANKFDNIIQIANDKTLSISSIKYGDIPSVKNVGTANDIQLEVTIPVSEKDMEIEIGKVETGDTPSVKKRLMDGKLYLDFVLPVKGDQGIAGPQGDAATIEIGRVSIGNVAKVENVGTKNKAILNFTLPYASGQGSFIPSQGGESSGGDKKTAEELKNVTAGINRSAKATEELENTIANILSQVTAMVEQNKVIISRVVNQSEQLTKTLGDRIDANKLSIKAIQMTTIDRSMLDETKSRISNCEETIVALRGELRQVFISETYKSDMKEISYRLKQLDDSVNTINSTLKQLETINDEIDRLTSNGVQDRANIELLQSELANLSVALASKQDAGQLVTMKDLDAGLKNSVDSINGIRITANQNAKRLSDVCNDVNNLTTTVEDTQQAVDDIRTNYPAGDKANKALIDNLSSKVDSQTKVFNETIAEIQSKQDDHEERFAEAKNVYTKKEVNEAISNFLTKDGGAIVGNLEVSGTVKANTFDGRLVGNADSATTSIKATNDGNGNNIADTYVTKKDFNSLSSKLTETAAKAESATTQLATYADKVNENATEIIDIKSVNESLATKIKALGDEKVDKNEITTLQNLINANKEDCDTQCIILENEFANYMPKNAIIPESQIDNKFVEKLNGISVNAEAISFLSTKLDTLAEEKAGAAAIETLQNSLKSTQEENDAKHEALENKIAKCMPNDAVISEEQLDSKIVEKLNNIDSNTEAISQIQKNQEAVSVKSTETAEHVAEVEKDLTDKITANTDDISSLRETLTKKITDNTEGITELESSMLSKLKGHSDTISALEKTMSDKFSKSSLDLSEAKEEMSELITKNSGDIENMDRTFSESIAKNADDISSLQESLSKKIDENAQTASTNLEANTKQINTEIAQIKQTIPVPQKMLLATIDAMFEEYMPKKPDPTEPSADEPTTDEPVEPSEPTEPATNEPTEPIVPPTDEPTEPPSNGEVEPSTPEDNNAAEGGEA